MVGAQVHRCRGGSRRAMRLLMPWRARMQREGQSSRRGDSVSRGEKGAGNRKWSKAEETGFYGKRMYVQPVKSVAFPLYLQLSSNPSSTGDEERRMCLMTQNTQVAKEKQYSRILTIRRLYCTLLARNKYSIVLQPRALLSTLRLHLRRV